MFKAYVITTRFAFPENEKVKGLTERCIRSAKNHGLRPVEFSAITPYNLEEVMHDWEINLAYAERLKGNFERKTGTPITPEMMNRMLVMQMSMTMSHYQVRKQIFEKGETAVILEHDAIVQKELPPLHNWENKVTNLCSMHQHTHGYVVNAKNAKIYNDQYEKTGFVGHDNMSKHINEWLKITPFSSAPIVVGNHVTESQWDTHRGALREKNLKYMPQLPGIEELLAKL